MVEATRLSILRARIYFAEYFGLTRKDDGKGPAQSQSLLFSLKYCL